MLLNTLHLLLLLFLACFLLLCQATINVSLVGRTGDGKSTFANLFYRLLGGDPNNPPFSESSSVYSHTHQPQSVLIQDLKITDHPGLVDSGGTFQDEKNIALIVNHMKEDKVVHAFLLVVNEQSPRFDSACQSALKLMVDSFGQEILSVTGVVFTRSYTSSAADAQKFMTEQLRPIIANVTGVDVSKMPFWQVDSHPEVLWANFPDMLSSKVARNERAVQEIRRWASANHPVDVSNAVRELYPSTVLMSELEQKREETIADTVDPSKTKQECREVVVSRVDQHSKRYGGHCFGLFGARKYRDYWTDVTYRRECRSQNYNQTGKLLNTTDWVVSGTVTRQEGRYKRNVCP